MLGTTDLYDDFVAMHCASFKDLSPEIAETLTSKMSDYVGVQVTQVKGNGRPMVKWGIFCAAVLLVIGAWPLVHNAKFGSLGTAMEVKGIEPARISGEETLFRNWEPILRAMPHAPASVFQARAESGAPQYLRRLAKAVPLDATKRYEIQVTVIPIETSDE